MRVSTVICRFQSDEINHLLVGIIRGGGVLSADC